MMMRKISAVILIVLVAALCACTKKTGAEPSRLYGKLYSGQSLQTVQRELGLKAGDWEVVQDERALSGSGQPPSRLYVISKKNWNGYGQSGELVLTFFNDELISTQFFPADVESARNAVAQEQQIAFDAGEAKIAPSTRVWVGKDQAGRSYIGWIDKVRQNSIDARTSATNK